MDKEVAKWLHQQLGYNAAADSTLSANCRGNLKTLWEFLMANYKTPENQKHVQNVLEKHRREQEIARLAPELRQQALRQKQRLKQLDERAVALNRTLASFQAAIENSTQDAAEQYGEQGLLKHELREVQTQTIKLQSAKDRVQLLLPLLQGKLCKLQSDAELAKARSHASGGNRRLQNVSLQLQDLSSTIREELMQVLDRKLTQQQQLQQQHSTMAIAASEQNDSQHGLDQQLVSTQQSSNAADCKKQASSTSAQQDTASALAPQSSSGSLWEDLNIRSGSTALASGDLSLGRCSLVKGYSPSQGVRATAVQLLQEAPELLLTGSSQLAAHSSHELCTILNEAETALLAPLAWGTAGQENTSSSVSQSMQQLQGLLRNAGPTTQPQADSCPFTLPWTIPWQSSLAAAAAGGGQQDAEFQSPEALVKQRQQMHVQLFVQAKAAKAAAAAADKELTHILGSTPLLRQGIGGFDGSGNSSNWEAQLAGLWLRAEGLRAEVQLLQQRKAEFERGVDGCLQSEQQLQEKWASIEAAVADDQELNALLWQVVADNMELYAALCSQQEQVLGLLRSQIAPCGAAASSCAISGRDGFVSEVGVVGKLPLAGVVPAQCVAADREEAGEKQAGSVALPTLVRLQLAAQRLSQLGRPTTVPKAFATAARIGAHAAAGGQALDATSSSSSSGVDTAAVSALRAAAAVDAMASARCPAALLLEVADQYQQLRQLQQQLEQLNMLCRGATTSAHHATEQAERLQQQVDDLRAKDQQEVLPWLQDKLESVQQQRMFAKQEVALDITHSSEMPAQHLLPHKKYEGWSCSEWLAQIQLLHGKKRELKAAATTAHR